MKRIYLDHASTTYLDPAVEAAMKPYWQNNFGNASNIYKEGCDARNALNASRKAIASLIGSSSEEIFFTGGGTESDNLAILGIARSYKKNGRHIITAKIEHHAVLRPCEELEKEGFDVSYIGVAENGVTDPKEIKKNLRKDTILVSIMYANNEIGTIQPISEIAKIIRDFKKGISRDLKLEPPFFHSDAMQAAGYLDLNVAKLGVDLMSVNGSKIYGPKGVGFLYARKGLRLNPLAYGGEQERGLRPGTENIAGIVGLAKAFKIAQAHCNKESLRLKKLRDELIQGILKRIPNSLLNGDPLQRLPNNVNISIFGVEGESLVLYLDAAGISCSTGSACTSHNLEPSHVITALGKSKEQAHCSIRLTLGRRNEKGDINYVLKMLPDIVKKLRNISAIQK